ncbi:MAG: DUF5320 domain-containing protein [Acidobacteriota bacterium]
MGPKEGAMPGFDGTGPRGQGPRTGGGVGRCAPRPEEAGVVFGVGRGGVPRGGGVGRCRGGRGEASWMSADRFSAAASSRSARTL